ncbi:MAG: RcnB family protein [Acinetobacter sp.]|uniref:RcnB family protein n=1 Tax=Acinetobacter sp. TaxID=472 RepID=UPI00257FAED1|nr:RcnB family protein [Acinetobacter sp.]MBR5556234.1 RcnB family protein [Acinetobacter sp.]
MKKLVVYTMLAMLCGVSASTQAENQWSNYQGVDRTQNQHRPHYPNQSYPQNQPHYPNQSYPHYPNSPYPPYGGYPVIRPGISIQYQAPTTITQNSQSYSWVNGDPNSARIESSSYSMVTDWQNLGLPAPPKGTYWVYQNGHYVLMSNR